MKLAFTVAALLLLALASGESPCETEAPPEAHAVVRDYVDYVLERDTRAPGYFVGTFGVEPPEDCVVVLGEPFTEYVLTRDGLRLFVENDNADVLTFAAPGGFGFTLLASGKIIGAVTALERKDGWAWSSPFPTNAPVIEAIREIRESIESGPAPDVATLFVRGLGRYVLTIRDGVIDQLAPPVNRRVTFGLSPHRPGQTLFVDYREIEAELKSIARDQFKTIDDKG